MTRSEVAGYLRLSERSIDRAREANELQTYVIRGTTCVRFHQLDVDKLMMNYDPQTHYDAIEYMTPREAAKYLRVHPKTIQRLKRGKHLKSHQPGIIRSPRFTKTDLDKLLVAD